MMGFFDLLLEHLWLTTTSAILLLTVIFLVWARYTTSLLGKDFWVAVPFLGKMAEWKKMTEGTGNDVADIPADAGYVESRLTVPAERALYDYYDDCLEKIDRANFVKARKYLKLSEQSGRKPMSVLLWLILGALTVAEALGTGLLLAPLLSTDITPELAFVAGMIIALVIATVALIITHGGGEDVFANKLLAKVRKNYRAKKGFRRIDGSVKESVEAIRMDDDQDKDADLESYGRLAARIGATDLASMEPRRMRIITAVAFIVLFGTAITVYRHYALMKQLDLRHSGIGGHVYPNLSQLFAHPHRVRRVIPHRNRLCSLPMAVCNAVHKSIKRTKVTVQNDISAEINSGVILLGLIYFFTQFLGFLTGMKYSFFDDEGKQAYLKTHGLAEYDDLLRQVIRPVTQRAQMRLGQLRSKLVRSNPTYGNHMRRFDFMEAYLQSLNTARMEAPSATGPSTPTQHAPNIVSTTGTPLPTSPTAPPTSS